MRILFAVLHLIALGIGLGAVFVRARAANRLKDGPESLPQLFAADTWWGVAAFLWISTGLTRVFASYEKSTAYYWNNHIFLAKMGLLVLVILLEVWPMITLIRWRKDSARGTLAPAELAPKGRMIARISDVQTLLVMAMVVAAVMMARGYGAMTGRAPAP
jgi:putative membrane protein